MADNHLEAFNDIYAALLDLKAALQSGDPDPQNMTQVLGDIENNIDALRATIEARSVAETTAANTNAEMLADAINAIRLICCTRINATGAFIPGLPPTDPATEFQDPPINFSIPEQPPGTSEYYERKCKIANAIHQNVVGFVRVLRDNDVDNMTGVASVVIVTVIGFAIGEMITPVPLIDGAAGGVIGFLAGLGIAIFKLLGELNLGQLYDHLNDNSEDLICALYEASPDTVAARADYLSVLDNAGSSAANTTLVAAILAYDLLNYLFFQGEEIIEASLDNYTPPYPCSDCSQVPCPDFQVIYGSLVSQNGIQYTFDSQYISSSNPAGHWFAIHFGQDENGEQCGPAKNVKIIAINQPPDASECSYRLSYNHFAGGYGCGNYRWDETANDWTPYIGVQKDAVRTLTLFRKGSTQFQVVLEIT